MEGKEEGEGGGGREKGSDTKEERTNYLAQKCASRSDQIHRNTVP